MGHTCGEPNESELTAAHGLFYRSFPGRTLDNYLAEEVAESLKPLKP